jgi:SAM-dependent methyltransferase
MSKVKSYFDIHTHHHPYVKDADFYRSVRTYLDRMGRKNEIRVLDVGCGNGSFLKSMLDEGLEGMFIGVDLSTSMINTAKENLKAHNNVHLFVADGFSMPIKAQAKFDIIHLDSVLHHIIGQTRSKSVSLVAAFLRLLSGMLSEKGIMLVEEMYYISYIRDQITSFCIFHGLRLLNSLRVDISSLRNEFQPGLEVNFFSEKKIEGMLAQHGRVKLIKKEPWSSVPKLYRIFLLKEAGHISYAASKALVD